MDKILIIICQYQNGLNFENGKHLPTIDRILKESVTIQDYCRSTNI